jgi:hypothetical protein
LHASQSSPKSTPCHSIDSAISSMGMYYDLKLLR